MRYVLLTTLVKHDFCLLESELIFFISRFIVQERVIVEVEHLKIDLFCCLASIKLADFRAERSVELPYYKAETIYVKLNFHERGIVYRHKVDDAPLFIIVKQLDYAIIVD